MPCANWHTCGGKFEMEETFDWREYWGALTKRWWLVVGLALVAAVAAFGFARLRPPRYRATVTLIAPKPQYVWMFDSAIRKFVDPNQGKRKEIIPLATSDPILEQVSGKLGGAPSVDRLKKMVKAEKGGGDLLFLRVTADDPQTAARIANAWAEVVVPLATEVYSDQGRHDDFVKAQKAALERLKVAEKALLDYRAQVGMGLADTGQLAGSQLSSGEKGGTLIFGPIPSELQVWAFQSQTLASYRHAHQVLQLLIEQAREARSAGKSTDSVPLELAYTLPVVQNRGVLTKSKLESASGDWDRVITMLTEEDTAVSEAIPMLEKEIQKTQESLAEKEMRLRQMVREKDNAERAYNAISRHLEEINASAIAEGGAIRLLGKAKPPDRPAGPSPMVLGVVAGAIGFLVGIFLAWAMAYLETPTEA